MSHSPGKRRESAPGSPSLGGAEARAASERSSRRQSRIEHARKPLEQPRETSILQPGTGGPTPAGSNLRGDTYVLKTIGGSNLQGKYATDTEEPDGPKINDRKSSRPSTWKTQEEMFDSDYAVLDKNAGKELIEQVLWEQDNPVQAGIHESGIEGIRFSGDMFDKISSPMGAGRVSPGRRSKRGGSSAEERLVSHIRRERVHLLQKVTKRLGHGQSSGGIYVSITEEQQRAQKQKYGFRRFMKDVAAFPPVQYLNLRLKRARNSLSTFLLLDVDLLHQLGRPDPKRFGERSLRLFPRDPPHRKTSGKVYYLCAMRRVCIYLVDWSLYNNLVLLLVMINGVVITMVDPIETYSAESYSAASASQRHEHLTRAIKAFNVIFVLELTVSLIAYGAYWAGPNSYLRDNWHKGDMLIVIAGLLDFIDQLNSLTPLRVLKIIRPLRTLTRFAVVREMTVLVVKLIPTLAHIIYLIVIMILVFAVVGVQLWSGIMRRRCFQVETGLRLGARAPFYGFGRTCTLQDSLNPGLFVCPDKHDCLPQVPEHPLRSFDNYWGSLMLWFQVLTLEGWGSICDRIIDAYAPASVLIFVVVLLLGPFLILKLFLATIALQLQRAYENNKWDRAKNAIIRWQTTFLADVCEQWAYNAKLHAIRRTEACTVFVLGSILRPMKEGFKAWRDFTLCDDGTEESKLAYLKRRNARVLRMQLADDALSLQHKIAFLMASHPRLGRNSPACVMQRDVRLWIKICLDASELMRTELSKKLFDKNWESDLYLSYAQARWLEIVHAQSKCTDAVTHPLRSLNALATSGFLAWLVVLASVGNTAILVLEHEVDSFPGKRWPDVRAWGVFHASLRICSITISAVYTLELVLIVLTEGPVWYVVSASRLLDLAIAVVCIFLLPVDVGEMHCFLQPTEELLLNVNSCYRADGAIWSLARSWRLLRFLKLLSTFPELRKQFMAVITSIRPVIGVLWLLALLVLIYVGIGINAFGGLLMQPVIKSDLVSGSSVFATVPWLSSNTKKTIFSEQDINEGQKLVPSIVEDIRPTRGLRYYLQLRTGFSNFAGAYDENRPREWAGIIREAAVGEVAITHTVPRENFNTFFFALTCVLQVVFNKRWSDLFWDSVEQAGFYSCWYYYSLIGVGNWLLLSISFAIIITTTQRQSVHQRYLARQRQEEDPSLKYTRYLIAFIVRNNIFSPDFWTRRRNPPQPADTGDDTDGDGKECTTQNIQGGGDLSDKNVPRVERALSAGESKSKLARAFDRVKSAQEGVEYYSSDDEREDKQQKLTERAATLQRAASNVSFKRTKSLDLLVLKAQEREKDPVQRFAGGLTDYAKRTKSTTSLTGSQSNENKQSSEVSEMPMSRFWSTRAQTEAEVLESRQRAVTGDDDNPGKQSVWSEIRLLATMCVLSRVYRMLKLAVVMINLAGTALERQQISPSEREVLQTIYAVSSALFVWDFVLQVFGLGVWQYFSSIYNILDTVALVSSLVDHIWSLFLPSVFSSEESGQLATESDPTQQVMYLALESALGKMVPTVMLVWAAFTGFAVLGQHLLSGIMHECSDPVIFERADCIGEDKNGAIRTWTLQGINFGWFGASMEAVWVIASSNDWPKIMWRAIDATDRTSGPYQNHNLAMALYFFGVASFSLLVLLNLFISVFVCVYLAQSREQAEARHKGVHGLVKLLPLGKPTRSQIPIIREFSITDPRRKLVHEILESVTAQSLINFCIFGTLVTMVGESYQQGAEQKAVLTGFDVFFTFIFGVEVSVRLFTIGFGNYIDNRWYCFDYFIYCFGVVDLVLESAVLGKWMRSARWVRTLRTIRLMRVMRSYRLLKSLKGVSNLLTTVKKALPMLLNLVVLLMIVFFTFGCLGVKMFGSMCTEGDQLLPGKRGMRCLMMQEDDSERRLESKLLGEHSHFRHLGWALLTLLKIGTVDGISITLNRLDTSPLPRLPDDATAMQNAIEVLRQLPLSQSDAERRVIVLNARKQLGGCVTAQELNQLQAAGVVDCRPVGDESDVYPACYTTCGSTWLSQVYFISFASITSFVLLNIMVSVLIVALGQAVVGRKPLAITPILSQDKLLTVFKRWKWNGVTKIAYAQWLVLNDYSDHSEGISVSAYSDNTSAHRNDHSFDLSSLSSCGLSVGSPTHGHTSDEDAGFESGLEQELGNDRPSKPSRGHSKHSTGRALREEASDAEELVSLPAVYTLPEASFRRKPARKILSPQAPGTASAASLAALQEQAVLGPENTQERYSSARPRVLSGGDAREQRLVLVDTGSIDGYTSAETVCPPRGGRPGEEELTLSATTEDEGVEHGRAAQEGGGFGLSKGAARAAAAAAARAKSEGDAALQRKKQLRQGAQASTTTVTGAATSAATAQGSKGGRPNGAGGRSISGMQALRHAISGNARGSAAAVLPLQHAASVGGGRRRSNAARAAQEKAVEHTGREMAAREGGGRKGAGGIQELVPSRREVLDYRALRISQRREAAQEPTGAAAASRLEEQVAL